MSTRKLMPLLIGQVVPGDNDREYFAEGPLDELAEECWRLGCVPEPISVRKLDAWTYEIMGGERRWRACKRAGHFLIDALVYENVSDEEASHFMLAENMKREDLNPIEEAKAYRKRMARFGWDEQKLAEQANVRLERVEKRLALLRVVPEVQHMIARGQLSVGYGEAMAELDANRQRVAMRSLVDHQSDNVPKVSVFRELCSALLAEQAQEALFDLADYLMQKQEEPVGPQAGKAVQPLERLGIDQVPDLPALKSGGTVGEVLEHYIVMLLKSSDPTLQAYALVIAHVYAELVRGNYVRVPQGESPLKAAMQPSLM